MWVLTGGGRNRTLWLSSEEDAVGLPGTTLKGRLISPSAARVDERLYRRLATDRGVLNNTLVPLGKAADRSMLWIIIALALARLGGRAGRRSAMRGLLSIAATSTLVNVPLKMVARRSRPEGRSVRTRFGRAPTSSSFPSGHAASAAAFATGAALEMPSTALPLAVLAAGVGASRVYAGVHYPTDVIAGALTGTVVASSLRRLWPVANAEPAEVRRLQTRSSIRARPEGEGIAFVLNTSAGSGSAFGPNPEKLIREELPLAQMLVCATPEEFAAALDKAAGAEVLGVMGGDGSVNAAAQKAFDENRLMAVAPGGTLNHLARDLGLTTAEDTIASIRQGTCAAVDAAVIDGKLFLNTASFGSYAELVDARERLEDRIGKWPALVVALVRVLNTAQPIEVEINGVRRSIWMIFIGNCRYHPSGFAPSWRERLDDGLLDVRIVYGHQPWARTRLVFALLTGSLANCGVYEHELATELTVRSLHASKLRLARDGETFEGSTTFTVGKLDKPLSIYVL
ncbi:MAG: phosphatase PAP2 family protein [Actinomycetota bacterium]